MHEVSRQPRHWVISHANRAHHTSLLHLKPEALWHQQLIELVRRRKTWDRKVLEADVKHWHEEGWRIDYVVDDQLPLYDCMRNAAESFFVAIIFFIDSPSSVIVPIFDVFFRVLVLVYCFLTDTDALRDAEKMRAELCSFGQRL
jgi:hypothetical protein